ncbi:MULTISPECIES: hypothetical protein [Enterobacteriaceae]|uniref:hypothetical protein n=1 Tax=Enterobacteriaceae TaxID=543 RepID=UPI0015DBEF25|nr:MULTISPECIES: hypothetical protein [unclassified Klebsiella]HAT3951527.1 hypothetical protein [Kluyvera ascorbata]BBR60714.1 hypothetical protein WP4W18E05_40820 [Klebsiella sp. WP4-W18-ESBL-05]BBS93409.1 hypothetical protein WP7S18C02_40240 [Klebsiella sp. WP7-S18-CRE-02]BBS98438.1 hypothetical protein WP7S18C03_40310 [Klebsiella sp. WP7-S18-CRE-03]BBT03505.1 hypothetical protein WP7S18E04_40670 [Klebsiella sp. WP7-S18-ESBL-04]
MALGKQVNVPASFICMTRRFARSVKTSANGVCAGVQIIFAGCGGIDHVRKLREEKGDPGGEKGGDMPPVCIRR